MTKQKKVEEQLIEEKSLEIKGAKVKDDFCNYTYELTRGVTAGDSISRNGASVIHDDMKAAFKKLNVHLAVICEEVDTKLIRDVDDIEEYDDAVHKANSIEAKASKFRVSAFRLDGTGENESVLLIGTKKLSTGDDVELKTPKVKWEGEYSFINELRVAVDDAKFEVEEYMNGKTAPRLVQQEMEFGEDGEGQE